MFVNHQGVRLKASVLFISPAVQPMEADGPFKKKRKGGIHQRLQQHSNDMAMDSCLQILLMTHFAKGIMSAAQVHEFAVAAKKDIDMAKEGYHFPKLDSIVKIQHSKNFNPSIMKELAKDSDLPMPREFDIPMEDTGMGSASSSILLPHELFHHLFHNAKGWASSILPDQRLLRKFWNSFKEHPAMASHPVLARTNYQDYCIPLSLHGDETPITGVGKIWCRKALLLTWSSLIAIAGGNSSEDCNLYIHGLFEKFIKPTTETTIGTMQAIWLILKWSFTAIWKGEWPTLDAWGRKYPPTSAEGRKAGQPLANGYYGCLVQLCGDLDYYASYLDVPRWSSHTKPCSQCRCSFEGVLSWLDNRSVAEWQNSLLSPHNWKTHWESRSALFQLPGMSACSVAMDLMHCLYLGWLQYVYGSVISLLVFECYGGEDYLHNLHQVGVFIRTFQARHKMKHRYRRRLDKLTMFQSGEKFPKLRGKASEIQSLALTLWTLWKHKINTENDHHRLIEFFSNSMWKSTRSSMIFTLDMAS